MPDLRTRILAWFRALTEREPAEVDLPDEARRSRLGSKGIYTCRLDEPSGPRGRRVRIRASESGDLITVAFYGPNDDRCTKVVMGRIPEGRSSADDEIQRWVAPDVLEDPKILEEARAFIRTHPGRRLTMTGGTVGCPHEEGEDFEVGSDCPLCPFWAGKQGSASEDG